MSKTVTTKHFRRGILLRSHRWEGFDSKDVYYYPRDFLDGDEDRMEVEWEEEGDKLGTVKQTWLTVWTKV